MKFDRFVFRKFSLKNLRRYFGNEHKCEEKCQCFDWWRTQISSGSSRHCSTKTKKKQRFVSHFLFQFQSIADTIFHSFDQAMQSGQIIEFNQFTSTILRWVEDSCRPSVKKKRTNIFHSNRFRLCLLGHQRNNSSSCGKFQILIFLLFCFKKKTNSFCTFVVFLFSLLQQLEWV